ncbi:tetratricopeptide repeat protein [Roseibium sediminicola]|uniref:Tetratricopeptide repeat protein n=1 Tax=Roseibium sediminicola TaxID=2933272 RepID=A0ABT0GVR7_9HYPH|nr:tetratricopeptide repeat protein [Roseibium sp. CAU 1639]MCK7613529.1 tetratricopeptide repeat protein [Roseibium sp. CAU 1639]
MSFPTRNRSCRAVALASLVVAAFFSALLPAAADTDKEALFEALKNAPDEQAAEQIENEIWKSWLEAAPTPELQVKVETAMQRRNLYDFQGAKDLLDEVIATAPNYSEGWNQRAFVLFLQGNYEASLEDIERTLELEPRHFGALSGRAMIFMTLGRVKLGQEALREAVKIHPFLKERDMLIQPKGVDL